MQPTTCREIKQGTLYGFDLVLKVPSDYLDDETINENTVANTIAQYLEQETRYANDTLTL